MFTGLIIFAVVCLVVVAVQLSCMISYAEPKKQAVAEAPANACPEV